MSRVVNAKSVAVIVLGALAVTGGVLWSFSGVKVDARLHDGTADDRCPIDAPIQVSVANHTLQRLASVSVEIEGWKNGDSRSVLDGKRLAFTKVLNPFQSGVACFSDSAFKVVPSKIDSVKDGSGQESVRVDLADVIDEIKQYKRLSNGVELVVTGIAPVFK